MQQETKVAILMVNKETIVSFKIELLSKKERGGNTLLK